VSGDAYYGVQTRARRELPDQRLRARRSRSRPSLKKAAAEANARLGVSTPASQAIVAAATRSVGGGAISSSSNVYRRAPAPRTT
jgi:aspartate ammonia-lyase